MSFEYWGSEAHRGCHEKGIVAIELHIEDFRKTGRPREYTVFEMVLNRDSVATKGPDEGQRADTLDESSTIVITLERSVWILLVLCLPTCSVCSLGSSQRMFIATCRRLVALLLIILTSF